MLEYEGDSILFAVAETKDVESISDHIPHSLRDTIQNLNDQQLHALADSVVADYLLIGNKKFNPGVDLSLRLWETSLGLGGDIERFGHIGTFREFAEQMGNRESLLALVHEQLEGNQQRVEIVSEADEVQFYDGGANKKMPSVSKLNYVAKHTRNICCPPSD